LHSFCENCIKNLSKEKDKVKCPLDNKEFKIEKGGFPSDFFKNSLLETLRASENKSILCSLDEDPAISQCSTCFQFFLRFALKSSPQRETHKLPCYHLNRRS
jgi:hypothetical protein